MKLLVTLFLLQALLLSGAEQVKHRFLAIDNFKKKPQLIYVDESDPTRSWQVSLPVMKRGSYRSIQKIDESRILINHPDGAGEYDLKTGAALTWKISGLSGIQAALRLPDGRTLLASEKKFYSFDKAGRKIAEKDLDSKYTGRVRVLTLTSKGTILYSAQKPYALCEMNLHGELLKAIPLNDKGYKHILLANGNSLNSSGNFCKVVELNPAGEVQHFVGGKKEHPSLKLDFCSGWDLLANGNIVMTNWLGHGKTGTAVQLIEFSRDNKVVWTWDGRNQTKTITNVLMLK